MTASAYLFTDPTSPGAIAARAEIHAMTERLRAERLAAPTCRAWLSPWCVRYPECPCGDGARPALTILK